MKNKGFTLIELIITAALVLLMTAVALPPLGKYMVGNSTAESASEMSTFIQTARNRAIHGNFNDSYGVRLLSDRFILFKGAVFSAGESDNRTTLLPPGLEIADVTLAGGGTDIIFTDILGRTSQPGSAKIRVIGSPDHWLVTVSAEGVVETGWVDL
ncbi:MAG: Uncharacterized protein G01um101418_553 [Parcubacteria group bacterium Gr01-1014_18]|nr:MAG: Uncharacterized protein Greene041636_599 [Parcubacteria group bacterium Greene0416_36]TSC80936.1 MAG: Uncharacterized protein G01um101418_553 [Parcubacteria group bacterium Gr01-1014_18]TSC98721.1 MAG: Uncharacterized protein Greene101420_595 [Parcubacteria group bacterium Greene1014_20]TSD06473.1 MAG: Uncharacterized protein Greene07142_903 [Parcubacteria group bacterium Greene0714_2]